MQVSNQFHQNPLQELLNAKQEHQRQIAHTETQNIDTQNKKESIKNEDIAPVSTNEKRQTYGLLVLELMSDPEYQAFERATAGMSEGDKIIAAQSLYSLTSFYGGKIQEERETQKYTPYTQNQDFITRYKNAFASQNQIDLSS